MCSKSSKNDLIHQLPAGIMVGDKRTELFGDRKTKRVFLLHDGKTRKFIALHKSKKALLMERLLNDKTAIEDLKHLPMNEALEKFAFCVFGAADSDPDFDEHGDIKAADNFICSGNCQCLNWSSKFITIDGVALTPRQIEIIQLLPGDLCDKQIAYQLNISESTLDSHKTKLFEKFNVQSKAGLITKAIKAKIIQ